VPLYNTAEWSRRCRQNVPCWTGVKWVDWEHDVALRAGFKRTWPADLRGQAVKVLDVGCGDGHWTGWLRQTFKVRVLGVDALPWKGVSSRIRFVRADAELMARDPDVKAYRPTAVTFVNSLGCVGDWRAALVQAAELSDRILVYDNMESPTPPYYRKLKHRIHIPWRELSGFAVSQGWTVEEVLPLDFLYRRWIRGPQWLHPILAGASALADVYLSSVVPASWGRHLAVHIRTRT
jgi:hypothetical protein